MQPELIVDFANQVGEGPLWHPGDGKLYWVDIPPGKIYRYDPLSGESDLYLQGPTGIGGFTIQADGALLCFTYGPGVGVVEDGRFRWVIEAIPQEQGRKFNDVIADPVGRVFAGTIGDESGRGSLYRMDLDGTLTVVEGDIGISNGMGFALDHTRMYYTDSETYRIDVFDYDVDTARAEDFSRTGKHSFNGRVQWVHVKVGDDSHDHYLDEAERYRIAMSIQ